MKNISVEIRRNEIHLGTDENICHNKKCRAIFIPKRINQVCCCAACDAELLLKGIKKYTGSN